MKCDFCGSMKNVGVFATDYAPVSLSYCEECVKVQNIRPLEIAIYGWARLGEKYFTPRVWSEIFPEEDDTEHHPMVYVNGEYITVREMIENLTEEKIREWVKAPFRLELCLQKFRES